MTRTEPEGALHVGRGVRILGTLVLLVLGLAAIESAAQLCFRWREGYWRLSALPGASADPELFRQHPYLVAVPRPGARSTRNGITIAHDSEGFRGPELGTKRPGVTRVLLFGGSTTYGTGVSNGDTWADRLGQELGSQYEVVNLGVPGYTTVENVIQAAFWASELQPDIMVFYEGWNDARNTFVSGVAPDYSDFHAPSQYYNLGQDRLRFGNRLASVYYGTRALEQLLTFDPRTRPNPAPTTDKFTTRIDPRALALYRRNLGVLAAVSRELGAQVVFVPQVLNQTRPRARRPSGWVPFVLSSDLSAVVGHYNDVMKDVAARKGIAFAGQVLEMQQAPEDFIDVGHFSAAGSRKFARSLAESVRQAARASHGA